MTRTKAALLGAVVVLLVGGFDAEAVTLRYQANQVGDFVLIGNTLGQDCGSGVPSPTVGTVSSCGSQTSDTAPDVFWRADDAGGAVANSTITVANARSAAVLSIPAGAAITYARLYWSGVRATPDTTVTVDRAGTGAFSATVTADASASATSDTPQTYYQSTADVTTLVQTNGSGQYRIGGVDGVDFRNLDDDTVYAGWSMVVFYSLATDPPRNLAIFDGLDLINSQGAPVTVTLTGFQVPNDAFDAKLGAITYEGDAQYTGDSLSFNGVALSNTPNPSNNFFNGTRTLLGANVSKAGDLPRLTGGARSMSGMDLDVVDVTARLSQGQTSATITASTNQDFFLLGGFVTSIATTRPDFSGTTKTVADLNAHTGGAILAGDTLQYTIATSNTGFDTAKGVVLTDVLPAGLTFVPGSIRVTSGANTGTKTDATADDQGEYIAAARSVKVRLGTGANGTTGGTMAPNDATTVVFRVTVNSTTLGTVSNQANVNASGNSGALARDYPSDGDSATTGTQTTDVFVEKCTSSSDCSGATPFCLTSASPRVCVACLSSSNCSGTTPICNTTTHACQACASDAQCPGSAPACQGSGACGACSASNIGLCSGTTPICNTAVPTCVQCLSNSHCGGATPVCKTTTKVCVGCLVNADCGGATPICDPTFLTCRACGGDSECGGATPACQPSGRCGQCSAGNAVACMGATPVCEVGSGTCVRCVANADCSGTTPICDGGSHTCRACGGDGECSGATPACQASGACAQCSATNATACSGATPVCYTPSATCVPCVSNAQCGGTTPVCNTGTHACRACGGDGECSGATPACQASGACAQCSATNATACSGATPVCYTPSATCVPCVSNAQCGGTTPVCNTATHACRGCAGDGECGGATPACQGSGACGQCSATNATACGGATPVCFTATATCVSCVSNAQCGGATPICNAATHTCRACGGDSECGGATPACQQSGSCGVCSATNASACSGATPVCFTTTGTCVPCVSNAQCGGTTPVCNTATHTCRACGGDGECGGATPACQGSGACGQCSATNASACSGATPVCFAAAGTCVPCLTNAQCGGTTPVCNTATHTCRACGGDGECGGRDARLPARRRVRAVLGDQRERLRGGDAGLLHGDGDVRAVRVERAVRGRHADLRPRHPHLPRVRRRQRVRWGDPGVPAVGRVRAVLGDQRDRVLRRDPRLLRGDGDLRALHLERAVRGHHAGLQHGDAHLPRLRGRRRVRRRDTGLPGVGRLRAVLGDERDRVLGGDARLLRGGGDLRALHLERAVRGRDAGLQHGDAHLPRLRGRRRVRRRDARLPARRRVRAVLGDQRRALRRHHARLLHGGRRLRVVRVERAVWRRHADLQRRDAHLPRLRGRR